MTPEQFENRMNFIVEQQAHFAADIQQLKESITQLNQSQNRTDGMLRTLVEVNLNLTGHIQEISRRMDERDKEWDERFHELRDSQLHTDERLDAFVDIVRKYIEGANGTRK